MTVRNHFNVIVLTHIENDITIIDMRVIDSWATETTETAQEVIDAATVAMTAKHNRAVSVYVQPVVKDQPTTRTPAQIIAAQLGGRFRAMVGALYISTSNPNQLQVNFPSSNGLNRMLITLDASDLYTVEFGYYRGGKYFAKKTFEGVYSDMLHELFTAQTGLYTRL